MCIIPILNEEVTMPKVREEGWAGGQPGFPLSHVQDISMGWRSSRGPCPAPDP